MIPLTIEEYKSYHQQKVCHVCKKEFSTDNNDKKYYKVRDHCHYAGKCRDAAHNICNLRCKASKEEIPVVFHNGSKYEFSLIIKELAEEFKEQFECLGENTEKYMAFLLPINKEINNKKTITDKIKFIDGIRFMSSSLSNLVANLSEGLHNNKCTNQKSYFEYMLPKEELLIFNCPK